MIATGNRLQLSAHIAMNVAYVPVRMALINCFHLEHILETSAKDQLDVTDVYHIRSIECGATSLIRSAAIRSSNSSIRGGILRVARKYIVQVRGNQSGSW